MSKESQTQQLPPHHQPLFTPAPATASGSGQSVAVSATGNNLDLKTDVKASYRSTNGSKQMVHSTGNVEIDGGSHNQINTGYQSNRSCSIL